MVIRQDGHSLQNISAELRDIVREITNRTEEMFADCDRVMGNETETGKSWYGPRAAGCKVEINKAQPTYNEMEKAIDEVATKVNGDAISWGRQQTSKY